MKKTLMILLPAVIYCLLVVSIPGMISYLKLRYTHELSPSEIEAGVEGLYFGLSALDGGEGIYSNEYFSAEDIRKLDPHAFREFLSASIANLEETRLEASFRSIGYYHYLNERNDIEGLVADILEDLSNDYQFIPKVQSFQSDMWREAIENIAEDEPRLRSLIERPEANKPGVDNPVNAPDNPRDP